MLGREMDIPGGSKFGGLEAALLLLTLGLSLFATSAD